EQPPNSAAAANKEGRTRRVARPGRSRRRDRIAMLLGGRPGVGLPVKDAALYVQRQLERDDEASAVRVGGRCAAAVYFEDASCDGEPEPGAVLVVVCLWTAIEGNEEPRHDLVGHARSVIADVDEYRRTSGCLAAFDRDLDARPVRRVPHRVPH